MINQYNWFAGPNDASSRSPPGNRRGLFPSLSAGWVLTRERFPDDVAWLSNFKLRRLEDTIENMTKE